MIHKCQVVLVLLVWIISIVYAVDHDAKRTRSSSHELSSEDHSVEVPHQSKKTAWDLLLSPEIKKLPPDARDLIKFELLLERPNADELYLLVRDNSDRKDKITIRDRLLASTDPKILNCMPYIFEQAFKNQDDDLIEAFLKSPRLVNWNSAKYDPPRGSYLLMFEDFESIMSKVLFPDKLSLRHGLFPKFMPLSQKTSKFVFEYIQANGFTERNMYFKSVSRSWILAEKLYFRGLFENRPVKYAAEHSGSYKDKLTYSILSKKSEMFHDAKFPLSFVFAHDRTLYLMARTGFNEPLQIPDFVKRLKVQLAEKPLTGAFVQNLYQMANSFGNQEFVHQAANIIGIEPKPGLVEFDIDFYKLAFELDDPAYYHTLLPMNQLSAEMKESVLENGSVEQITELIDASGIEDLNEFPPDAMKIRTRKSLLRLRSIT
jgi:hypothetical protein